MVVNNLLAIRYRKYILTTNSRHDYPVYVNCGCPFVHGLRAGVRLASAGVEGHGVGKGASGDHSHAVAEDRRPGACECAARLPGDGGELPLGEFVRAGSRESAGSRAGLRKCPQPRRSQVEVEMLFRGKGAAELRAGLIKSWPKTPPVESSWPPLASGSLYT